MLSPKTDSVLVVSPSCRFWGPTVSLIVALLRITIVTHAPVPFPSYCSYSMQSIVPVSDFFLFHLTDGAQWLVYEVSGPQINSTYSSVTQSRPQASIFSNSVSCKRKLSGATEKEWEWGNWEGQMEGGDWGSTWREDSLQKRSFHEHPVPRLVNNLNFISV